MSFKAEPFVKVVYFSSGASGTGNSASDALPISDQTIFTAEAGSVISEVCVVVTTALTGTTQLDIGDAGDADGFVAAATLTAAASQGQGAYLNNGGSNKAKYYSAATAILMDNTTTNTAGAGCVIIKGYKI